jgi:hypothetical protein
VDRFQRLGPESVPRAQLDWMQTGVTALEPHPNDPAVARS